MFEVPEELVERLVRKIAFSGRKGCSVVELIGFIKNGPRTRVSVSLEEGQPRVPGERPGQPEGIRTPTLSLESVSTIWGWITAESDISVGERRKWNHLSLQEVLSLPEDARAAADGSNVGEQTQAARKPTREATHPPGDDAEKGPRMGLPRLRPRVFVSETRLWFLIAGHGPDHTKITSKEWEALLGIASVGAKGIIQGDLTRLTGQDKRSLPKRTHQLADKGYIVKRTTLVRGCKTSKLWLKALAPPALNDESSGRNISSDLMISREAIVGNLDPVPWHDRWTGDSVDYVALGKTIMAIIKTCEIIRYAELRMKLGVVQRHWHMRVLARTCRFFVRIGVIEYAAAVLEGQVFRDCIKYVRDLQPDDWDEYLATGKRARRRPTSKLANRGPKGGKASAKGVLASASVSKTMVTPKGKAMEPSWIPDKPISNTIFEAIRAAGDDGLGNTQICHATLGPSFSRYLFTQTAKMAHPGLQPPHLAHLQITVGERLHPSTPYQYKAGRAMTAPRHDEAEADTENLESASNTITRLYGFEDAFRGNLKPTDSAATLAVAAVPKRRGRPPGRKRTAQQADLMEPQTEVPNKRAKVLDGYGVNIPAVTAELEPSPTVSVAAATTPARAFRVEAVRRGRGRPRRADTSLVMKFKFPLPPSPEVRDVLAKFHTSKIVVVPADSTRPSGASGPSWAAINKPVATLSQPDDDDIAALPQTNTDASYNGETDAAVTRVTLAKYNKQPTENPPTEDAGESNVVTAKPPNRGLLKKGRRPPKVLAGKLFRCEKCGGSWKNDNGLAYHLTKSNTTCNPNYDPSTRKSALEKRIQILENEGQGSEAGGADSSDSGPRTRTRNRAASSQESGSVALKDRGEDSDIEVVSTSQKSRKGRIARPSFRMPELFDSYDPSHVTAAEQVDMDVGTTVSKGHAWAMDSMEGTAQAARAMATEVAKGSPELFSTQRSVATRTPKRRRTKLVTADAGLGFDAHRGKLEPSAKPLINESELASATAGTDEVQSSHGLNHDALIGDGDVEVADGSDSSPTARKGLRGSVRAMLSQLTVGYKVNEVELCIVRTVEIVRYLLRSYGGAFPGDKSLWYAVRGVWATEFPDTALPDLRSCQLAVGRLVDSKEIRQHTYAFRAKAGCFVNNRIIMEPAVDPHSELVTTIKAKIKEGFPAAYVPSSFRPPPDTLPVEASQPPSISRRRKIGEQIGVLDAPFYSNREWKRSRDEANSGTPSPAKRQYKAGFFSPDPKRPKIVPMKADFSAIDQQWPATHDCAQDSKTSTWSSGPASALTPARHGYRKMGDRTPGKRGRGRFNPEDRTVVSRMFAPPLGKESPSPTERHDAASNQPRRVYSNFVFLEPNKYLGDEGSDDVLGGKLEVPVALTRWEKNKILPPDTFIRPNGQAWPSLDASFFEKAGKSYTMDGPFPSHRSFAMEHLVDFLKELRRRAKGKHNTPKNRDQPDVLSLVESCLRWEMSPSGEFWANHGEVVPGQMSIDFKMEEDVPFDPHQPLVWNHTFHRYTGLRKKAKPKAFKRVAKAVSQPASAPRVKRRYRKREKLVLSGTVIGGAKTRQLSALPTTKNKGLKQPVKHGLEHVMLVAIVVLRTVLGGVDKVIDWGLLARLFPGVSTRATKNLWSLARKDRQEAIRNLTQKFQEQFVKAYAAGELPPIDFDQPLDYDWVTLIQWTLDLEKHAGIKLPTNRVLLDDKFRISTVAASHSYWKEAFHFPNASVFSRFEVATAAPATSAVDDRQPETNVAMLQEQRELRISKSWLRVLCCSPEGKYDNQIIKAKWSKLVGGDDERLESLLDRTVATLREERVIGKSRSNAMGRRPYKLSDWFNNFMTKAAHAEKFQDAEVFKTALDRAFRLQEKFRVPYAGTDGMFMAIINLQAQGRIELVPVDIPHVPFGLEPGKYETRKTPKSMLHFNVDLAPTDSYLYDDDIDVLARAVELEPPPADPRGEMPLWRDLFGVLDRERWCRLVGMVLFALATRGSMSPAQMAASLWPALDEFEVQGIYDWAWEMGLLRHVDGEEGVTVAEWWWLAVPKLRKTFLPAARKPLPSGRAA